MLKKSQSYFQKNSLLDVLITFLLQKLVAYRQHSLTPFYLPWASSSHIILHTSISIQLLLHLSSFSYQAIIQPLCNKASVLALVLLNFPFPHRIPIQQTIWQLDSNKPPKSSLEKMNQMSMSAFQDLHYEITPFKLICKQKNKRTKTIYLIPKKSDSFLLYKPLNLIFLSFFSQSARIHIQIYSYLNKQHLGKRINKNT